MGVDAVLMRVEQQGTSPRRRSLTAVGTAVDRNDALVRLVDQTRGRSATPMLQRLDPYGSVIFSSAEMPQFLEELTRLEALAETSEELRVIQAFEELAHECAADPTLELHLDGD
ncbi:hypothetical protein [Sphaerisporangium sp. TRM90804]|uniref:hypothetical protein n=1 Tax=Sphaerisporangium sp. TRM90804 TaxID=3031113 RepID=UPI0024496BEF|nr:hypothetical protein [Sphaerisporangium sp. TRM90804]MDH2429678.1 hypothetical protein [Sphaerisporangium sp. TRM90804]